MRRAGELIKKQIVQIDTGNIVGHVEDLLLDPDAQQLAALITTTARWLREAWVLPWASIQVSTGDVILVQPGAEPAPIHDYPQLEALSLRKIHVSGTTVVTASGKKVGSIAEVMIDPHGVIVGYAVGLGMFHAEKQFVAAAAVEVLGTDTVIIKDASLRDFEDTSASHAFAVPRVMLPFTGTPVIVEEPAPTTQSLPQTELEALELGEELMHRHKPPAEPPPATAQVSAAEMLPAHEVVPPTQQELIAKTALPPAGKLQAPPEDSAADPSFVSTTPPAQQADHDAE